MRIDRGWSSQATTLFHFAEFVVPRQDEQTAEEVLRSLIPVSDGLMSRRAGLPKERFVLIERDLFRDQRSGTLESVTKAWTRMHHA